MLTTLQPSLYEPITGALLRLLLPEGERVFPWEVDGEVRTYANGSTRLIRGAGLSERAEQTVWVDPAGYELLRAWAGELVLYRDGLGHRLWCTFLAANGSPTADGRHYVVPLVLHRLSHSEAV